jgi:HSP20 family protein
MCNYQSGYRSAYHCGGWKGRGASSFAAHFRNTPVNIVEREDHFELKLYAPGLVKEAIKVYAKDDVLYISYESPQQQANEPQYTRREYHTDSFQRSFLLNGKVETDKIVASYADGILRVTLPKNPQTNKPGTEVKVD